MWFIGDKSRPKLGAVSGPKGWKTKEECEEAIKQTILEVAQIKRQNLKIAIELSHGNLKSEVVKYEAGELERQLRHTGNLVPIEVLN